MTLFTSDTEHNTKASAKYAILFLIVSALCILFSLIYESFSYGVHSDFMMLIFVFPFGATLIYILLGFLNKDLYPHAITLHIFNAGVCTASLGFCIKGILEIYGTDSPFTAVYDITAVLLVSVALILYLIQFIKHRIS